MRNEELKCSWGLGVFSTTHDSLLTAFRKELKKFEGNSPE